MLFGLKIKLLSVLDLFSPNFHPGGIGKRNSISQGEENKGHCLGILQSRDGGRAASLSLLLTQPTLFGWGHRCIQCRKQILGQTPAGDQGDRSFCHYLTLHLQYSCYYDHVWSHHSSKKLRLMSISFVHLIHTMTL